MIKNINAIFEKHVKGKKRKKIEKAPKDSPFKKARLRRRRHHSPAAPHARRRCHAARPLAHRHMPCCRGLVAAPTPAHRRPEGIFFGFLVFLFSK
jgi:hypothetical protein